MTFKTKQEAIAYIKTLLEQNIHIDYYRLRFILEENNIEIANLFFAEDATKEELILLSFKEVDEESVTLTFNKRSWNHYLPGIYQDNDTLKQFLYGFQQLYFHTQERIDTIEELFSAEKTDFIDWLGSWFGLKFHSILSEERKRKVLAQMIELYQQRGTKQYFVTLIKLLTDVDVSIEKEFVGSDYYAKQMSLHKQNTFKVNIAKRISEDQQEEKQVLEIINTILQKEKPIHVVMHLHYDFVENEEIKEYEENIIEYVQKPKGNDTYDYDALDEPHEDK